MDQPRYHATKTGVGLADSERGLGKVKPGRREELSWFFAPALAARVRGRTDGFVPKAPVPRAPRNEGMLPSNEHPRVSLSPSCKSRPQYENIPARLNLNRS